MMPSTSWGATARSTSLSASIPPKRTVSSRTSRTGDCRCRTALSAPTALVGGGAAPVAARHRGTRRGRGRPGRAGRRWPRRSGRALARGTRRRSAIDAATLSDCSTSTTVVPSRLSCAHGFEQRADDRRRQPERQLVDEQQLRVGSASARATPSICCWPPDSRPARTRRAVGQRRGTAPALARPRRGRRRRPSPVEPAAEPQVLLHGERREDRHGRRA